MTERLVRGRHSQRVLYDQSGPDTLVTPEGRQILKAKGGAAGEVLANNYGAILKATGEATPVGRRV